MKDSVFLSYPKPYLEKQKQFIEKVVSYLENRGLQPRTSDQKRYAGGLWT